MQSNHLLKQTRKIS